MAVTIIAVIFTSILAAAINPERGEKQEIKEAKQSKKSGRNSRTAASIDNFVPLDHKELVSGTTTMLLNPDVLDNKVLQLKNSLSKNPNFQLNSTGRIAPKSLWFRDSRKILPEQPPSIARKITLEETGGSSVRTKTVSHFENSELFLEIETNIATAKAQWTGKLLPFQTSAWDSSLYEVDSLPAGKLNDLNEAYVDIRLANELVWLSEVVGHIGKEIKESYVKLCSNIAERLDRARFGE
jgi:hypothetical protein